MQPFISILFTCLLLALSGSATAQPAPGAIPNAEKGTEQATRGECFSEMVDCHDTKRYSALLGSDRIPPPPPPPPPRIICSDIFRVVEEMPRFPGCEHLPTLAEKKQCANEKLLKFIYDNINYPIIARENGVEGIVVVQFVVEKDGSVTDARVIRDIGAQCGQEALRIVGLMTSQRLKWTPGKQRGRAVRVQFNLPVKFILKDHIEFSASSVTEVCSATEKPVTEAPLNAGYEPPPPPQCPPSPYHLAPQKEEVFGIVEQMPRFPCLECEALPMHWEKKQCSDKKLLEFLYQNLTYPALARDNCVAGTVVIQFYVEKDGALTNAKVVRDIGGGCGEAALDVVNLMSERGLKWIPGSQRGRAVRVQFHLPIKFRIECPDTPLAPAPDGPKENNEQAEEALHHSEATPSGTPLNLKPEGFRLFPNPTADWLNVRFQPETGPVSMAIVSTSGQVLWEQAYEQADGFLEERVNLTSWPPGTYFLRTEQQGKIRIHPFVRQR